MSRDRFMPMEYRVYRIVSYVVGGLVLVLVVAVVFGFVIKFLWNAALAPAFGLGAITFWQAVGLFVLAKLFFGFGSASAATGTRGPGFRRKRHASERAPNEDARFRAYWRDHGRDAYDTFLAQTGEDKKERNGGTEG